MTDSLIDIAVLSSAWQFLAVALAGGAGALCRFLLDAAVQRPRIARGKSGPLGILLVNLIASVCIGGLAGAGLAGAAAAHGNAATFELIVASGFLGGFSTFSTVAVDTVRLLQNRDWGWIALNTVGMLVLCAAACLAGYTAVGAWL